MDIEKLEKLLVLNNTLLCHMLTITALQAPDELRDATLAAVLRIGEEMEEIIDGSNTTI